MSQARWYSNSQSYTWAKCPKQYAYKYVVGLKPLARDMREESWLRMGCGIIGHGGMEYGMLGMSIDAGVRAKAAELCAQNVPQEFKDALLAQVADISALAQSAAAWLPISDWEPIQRNGAPMVEARLELPLPAPWAGLVGYADMVARHKPSGRIMVVDYKFRGKFEAEDSDRYNRQFALYQHALNLAGIECHGSLLFEIKTPAPKRVPKTTHDDFGSIDAPRTQAEGRFRTTPTFRSAKYVAALYADTVKEATAAAACTLANAYRNLNAFNCKDCAYLRICQAELTGEDTEDVIQSDFSSLISLPRRGE